MKSDKESRGGNQCHEQVDCSAIVVAKLRAPEDGK